MRRHLGINWPLSTLALVQMPSFPQPSITCVCCLHLLDICSPTQLVSGPRSSSGPCCSWPPSLSRHPNTSLCLGALGNSDLPTNVAFLCCFLPHPRRCVGGMGGEKGWKKWAFGLQDSLPLKGNRKWGSSVLRAPDLSAGSVSAASPAENSVSAHRARGPSCSALISLSLSSPAALPQSLRTLPYGGSETGSHVIKSCFCRKLWVLLCKRLRLLQTTDCKFLRSYFGTFSSLLYQPCLSMNKGTIAESSRGKAADLGYYTKVSSCQFPLCVSPTSQTVNSRNICSPFPW